MENEKSFEEERLFYKNRIDSLCKAFEKNKIHSYYADDKADAKNIVENIILSNINPSKGNGVIGVGDSQTLHQIELFDWLYSERNLTVINPFERLEDGRFSEFKEYPNEWLPLETYNEINARVWEKARKALLSDVFVTGANAVTMQGQIVSTDGAGNRIAAVIYGPLKVVIVIGRNKIVNNLDEAFNRIKHTAAPLNHLRHSVKHRIQGEQAESNYGIYKLGKLPCVQKGYCVDCGSPLCTRKCTMVMDRATGGYFKDRLHVVIVNEDLGL